MEFRERLYQLRKGWGISQEELANAVGVSRQAVQKWEAGASTPDLNNLSALAGYFSVTLDYLVRGVEPEAPQAAPAERTVIHNYFTPYHYEYRSKCTLLGLPLVHIHLGYGLRRARGIIAIGNVATGLVAIGGFSAGLLSIGGLGIGLLTLAGLAAGGLAVGGVAFGLLAALGGGAFSLGAALGGCAVSRFVAVGGAAVGQYAGGAAAFGSLLAIGQDAESARGLAFTLDQLDALHLSPAELLSWLQAQAPEAPRWVLRLLLGAAGR